MMGDEVTVAGVAVGRVEKISLADQEVRVDFTIRENLVLGDATTVDIKTNTILGRKSLKVVPAGTGAVDTIPSSRTNSPYSLTDALGDLGTTVSELDTDQLGEAMNVVSDTLTDTPPELRAALDGVSRLSASINSRDETLQQLLERAESVTGILAQRSGQVDQLIRDGNDLFGELDRRRTAISQLISNVSAVVAAVDSVGSGEPGADGSDARQAQLGGGGTAREQREHRRGTRRTRPLHQCSRRVGLQRPLLHGLHPEHSAELVVEDSRRHRRRAGATAGNTSRSVAEERPTDPETTGGVR